jgi:RNA polymerase sigma-70 factor (ECF subfamily)
MIVVAGRSSDLEGVFMLASRIDELEQHRRGLTRHCHRMLRSHEADDAVQETMLRAWRSLDGFEGRAALSSWLYRIATNVCLDLVRKNRSRSTAIDLRPAAADLLLGATAVERAQPRPIPAIRLQPEDDDPAEVAARRESIRLAFVATLQHLPPRQRAVVIMRDVLSWPARDVAEMLDTSVAAVNSALQRARSTLATADGEMRGALDEDRQARLADYLDAFERYDTTRLVSLLHQEAHRHPPPLNHPGRGQAGVSNRAS